MGGRSRRSWAPILASLTLALAAPASARASEPSVIVRASLEIDTTQAGAAGPVIHSRLDELGSRQLRRAEVLPGRSARDPWIELHVRTLGEDAPGFVITSALRVDGEVVDESRHESECRLCTESEAVERATAEIDRLVPLIRAQASTPTAATAPASTAAAPASASPASAAPASVGDEAVDPAPANASEPLGARGKAGVATIAIGVVAIGVGVGLSLAEPRPDPEMPLNEISTRGAGLAMIGVGAAAAITGVVLLVVDRRARARTLAWSPTLTPGGAGFAVSARF